MEVSNVGGVVLQVSKLPDFKAEIEAGISFLKAADFKTNLELSTKSQSNGAVMAVSDKWRILLYGSINIVRN